MHPLIECNNQASSFFPALYASLITGTIALCAVWFKSYLDQKQLYKQHKKHSYQELFSTSVVLFEGIIRNGHIVYSKLSNQPVHDGPGDIWKDKARFDSIIALEFPNLKEWLTKLDSLGDLVHQFRQSGYQLLDKVEKKQLIPDEAEFEKAQLIKSFVTIEKTIVKAEKDFINSLLAEMKSFGGLHQLPVKDD